MESDDIHVFLGPGSICAILGLFSSIAGATVINIPIQLQFHFLLRCSNLLLNAILTLKMLRPNSCQYLERRKGRPQSKIAMDSFFINRVLV